MCESSGEAGSDTIASAPESVGKVVFTEKEAHITIIQVPEVCQATDGKYNFKPASQQVIEQLLAHPTTTFYAELRGTNAEPHVNVVLKSSAIKALPLLADIHDEACVADQERVTVPFDPPCSVWSLVTVLLLLEGAVTIDGWLGNVEHDVSLPARTLEVRSNRQYPHASNLTRVIVEGSIAHL
jgi:hypothetical protein